MNRFVVMTASAKMPASCRGKYRRVAVVETDLPEPYEPARIWEHGGGVVKIHETWERLSVGKTPRSVYRRALAEAEALAERLTREELLRTAVVEERELEAEGSD